MLHGCVWPVGCEVDEAPAPALRSPRLTTRHPAWPPARPATVPGSWSLAAQTASGLPADDLGRMRARTVIVDEVERLRWRIWNGKAKNARRSIDRVRKVMHVYKDERGQHTRSAPSRRLWHALLDVDRYLRGQSNWLVNYAKRYRAGLRVGTSITEGAANFLVNRRMIKSQQMRWSRRGADPCFRFAARSTMERPAQDWATDFSRMLTRTSGWPTLHDPPIRWTLPGAA